MNIPCENCITFAICSAYVIQMEGNVRPLITKKACSLLIEYSEINGCIESRLIDKIRIVYGLDPVYDVRSKRPYRF